MTAELISVFTGYELWAWFTGLSIFVYGSFYGMAWAFEDRKVTRQVMFARRGRFTRVREVPVWRGQSRAFLPGDFGLIFMLVSCIPYRGELGLPGWLELAGLLVSLLTGVFAFKLARKVFYTQEDYKESWNSPTKLWHDFVMYILFCALLVYVCLPVWAGLIWHPEWRLVALVGFLVALVLWVGGMVADLTPKGKAQIIKEVQHPAAGTYQAAWPWLRRLVSRWRVYRTA